MTGNKRSFDDAPPLEDADGLTAEEQALFEQMQSETPMPTKDEGGTPPPDGSDQTDGKQRPKQEADAGEGEAELEDGEEEVTIEGQNRDEKGRFVSKSALLRVKEQNKQARAELERERQERARIEGRLQILTDIINAVPTDGKSQNQQAPSNPWEEPDINPAEDLLGAFEQQRRRADFERQQRESLVNGHQARERQVSIVQNYVADAKRLAAEHVKRGEIVEVEGGQKVPAFQAAYMYLVSTRHAQLEAVGVADKAERDRLIAMEEQNLVEKSIANQRSPAETIYALAKATGFKLPEKSSVPNGNGKGHQTEAEKKIALVRKGMEATQSLSGRGGQAYSGLTKAQIIAMGDDEFDAFTAKLSEEQLYRLLGAE